MANFNSKLPKHLIAYKRDGLRSGSSFRFPLLPTLQLQFPTNKLNSLDAVAKVVEV